jgi:hypothetical protein
MACISLFLGFETCFENEREMELHTVNFDVLLNFIRGYSFNEDTLRNHAQRAQ